MAVLVSLLAAPRAWGAPPTIAGAPALNVGAGTVTGGGDEIDYYKIHLNGGDKLQLSVHPAACANFCSQLEFDVYAPGTDDTTFTQSAPVDAEATNPPYGSSPSVLTLQAPYTGTYVLAVCEPDDRLDDGGDCRQVSSRPNAEIDPMMAYSFTSSVTAGCDGSQAQAATMPDASPTFAPGACESGGATDIDFWRVSLNAGDKLVLTVHPSGAPLEFDLYPAGTGDGTFIQSVPFDVEATESSGGSGQVVTLQAPYAGTFLLAVCSPDDISDNQQDCRAVRTGNARQFSTPMPAYTFTSALTTNPCTVTQPAAGAQIASAPALQVGACASGGGHDLDFWNVFIPGGTELQLDVTPPSDAPVEADLYAPGTRDVTFTQAAPVASETTYSQGRQVISLQVPYSGAWVLVTCEPHYAQLDCRSVQTGTARFYTLPMHAYTFSTSYAQGDAQQQPPGGGSNAPASPRSTLTIRSGQRPKVGGKGALAVTVSCAHVACTGKLTLTAITTKTTGHGHKRRTRKVTTTIGKSTFTGLKPGSHAIPVTLNTAGRKLLRKAHGHLTATVTASYHSGSTTRSTRETVALRG